MIDGVKILDLETHIDKRGFFREIFRLKEGFPLEEVGQISHSRVEKGIIKGWHAHHYQKQWNYVVTGKIEVALFDNRVESATFGQMIKFIAGEQNNICYFFPENVLHAYHALEGPMNIIYVTSGIYDLNDEIRISFEEIDKKPFK